MDISHGPNIESPYDKYKSVVKKWETNFKKQNGRIPSKLDIREASSDVHNAYKLYFRLKTAALEQNLMDIEGFDVNCEIEATSTTLSAKSVEMSAESNTEQTWGVHLNKQTKSEKKDSKKKLEKLSVNLSFTQKLFENSKSKKLPRKSLSFIRKKSEPDWKPQFFSQPECYTASDPLEISVDTHSVKTSNPPVSNSVNLVQNLVSNCINPVREVDPGWIRRAIGGNCIGLDDNDDIVANSEDELENSCSLIQIAKKRKMVVKETKSCLELATIDTTSKRLDFSNLFDSKEKDTLTQSTSSNKSDTNTDEKVVQKQKKKDSERENISIMKRQNSKKSQSKETNEQEPYELEYSLKPRIVTVPRFKDLKKVLKGKQRKNEEEINNRPKSKQEDALLKKLQSGSANDNFVRINLKKKIFVRGKSGRSFSKYKMQQWKKKKSALCGPDMDMGGCDGGSLTCFTCGQTGHFARNCSSNKPDSLLPLVNDEDEVCPYPTLEEAAKMARESVLAIRRPIRSNGENDVTVVNKENEYFDEDYDDELCRITEQLESDIAKIDVQKYIDTTTRVQPYYGLQENGCLIDTPQEVYDTLAEFGHTKFRPGQEVAIMRILSGKSTLVTLSTGTGKSLCYQLPAYLYSKREPCISLIISPLVSLMEDQVASLPTFLKAACLHTNQTKTQKDKVMEAIKTGNLSILLVSPEAVVAGEKSSGFGLLLRQLPPIAFACIDEAHCVSQWSHNFRTSYLKICRVLRDRLAVDTILGLTATATRSTSDSIIKHLSIPDGRDGIISDVPLPDNLTLTVSKDNNRDEALLALLLSDRYKTCNSIIIYCTRREECQRVATFLRTCLKDEAAQPNKNKRKRCSVQAEPYHAGLPASRRRSIQNSFMNGSLRIVVATVAFGMGINKSDIRAVVHYNMPMSFESYVQEVGRAGRDGLPAHCHLFLDCQGKDESELRRHVYANSTDRYVIRKLLEQCFIPCSCTGTCPKHEVAFSIQETVQALDIPEENIETLLCYLELHQKCYVEVLSHVYVTCRIVSYNGRNEIRKAAKECPPLAMALALYENEDSKLDNIFEFPVVKVASTMGWDSGICKHKLKNLEWVTVGGQVKRSQLNVEFSNLGFHLLAPGNLSALALDDALDDLYARVQEQQKTSMLQLHAINTTLMAATKSSFKLCISDDDISESVLMLKSKIREYFESPNPLKSLPELPLKPFDEEQIKNDIRSLICMYRDNAFTARAVARIFHGIQSPNYPAVIWGRCKFWRLHIGTDFNVICQISTREILRMRDI
ncbi:hypothetical protein FQA39_LY06564 [Lamprigera yunnana]|nr:hypothetical protein FQA39_LY06564 [Lamprigera yunnana]